MLAVLTGCLRINIERALRISVYSRARIAAIRAETGIEYDHLARGILHVFRDRREYESALPYLELMAEHGCVRRVVDADACVAIEPALAAVRADLVGGIMSDDDESGDAYAFTTGLADICAGLGVTFVYGTGVRRLVAEGSRIAAVETDAGSHEADAIVVALASYAPPLLRLLGLRLPVYPAKGYSVTLPVADPERAPVVSLIDDEFKMVYSRLGNRLRAAGTAEFAGYDTSLNETRARFIRDKALELFPGCADPAAAEYWAGLRPSTPDGVPVIGATPYANLYLNTGHGTLGWTMACGAGQVVADLIGGATPTISLDGLGIDRFG